jgi:hypothetical protein
LLLITAAGTYVLDGCLFSGNTYDIENSSAGAVTISCINGANPTTYTNTGGGSTSIVNNKNLTVTCLDEANEPVAGVIVTIHKASDITELMQDTTDVNGVASGVFNYSTDTDVVVWTRKSSSGSTRYINGSSMQTITENGLSVTMTMRVDPYAAA